jgi:uncharacterized damage-inducible protein DinB
VQIDDIRMLYDYLFWAHERTLPVVERLTPEEFVRDLGASHGSVRSTLVHMMSAQWLYLSRWHGVFPDVLLDPESFPTLAALEERWAGIRRELRSFLGRLREEHLASRFRYRNLRGEEVTLPFYVTLLHVVNHDTYHRGQVASCLRMLGQTPEATDLYRFYLEQQVLEDTGGPEGDFDLVSPAAAADEEEKEEDR